MGWKLFRALRWATDASKPALNKSGALLFTLDAKSLEINTGSGWVRSSTPPIGVTYIQFPGKSDPSTLWPNTTWSNISSETLLKGRVPRVEGTASSGGQNAAAAFGSSQDDQLQGHYHRFLKLMSQSVQSTAGSLGYRSDGANTADDVVGQAISDGANGTPRTGSATRDASFTVRIWQRTA